MCSHNFLKNIGDITHRISIIQKISLLHFLFMLN